VLRRPTARFESFLPKIICIAYRKLSIGQYNKNLMNMEEMTMILVWGIIVLFIAVILWFLKVAVSVAVIVGLVGLVVLAIGLFRRGKPQANR
jgi:hypothetical protein